MKLHPAEHAILDRLCDDSEARDAVFEHVCIGLMRGKVNGLLVALPLENLVQEYLHKSNQLDRT